MRQLLLAVCCFKSQYMYEYIIETETPLSELKTFPNCKETWAFSKAIKRTKLIYMSINVVTKKKQPFPCHFLFIKIIKVLQYETLKIEIIDKLIYLQHYFIYF